MWEDNKIIWNFGLENQKKVIGRLNKSRNKIFIRDVYMK